MRPSDVSLALGGLTVSRKVLERDPWSTETLETTVATHTESGSDWVLTAEQHTVVDALREAAGSTTFAVALLHGVTGSGKTEVYRRLARAALESKRQALILVPEIALTPAVATSFRLAFGERVAVQHSGLSEGARHDQWHRIRRGEVDVVIGTRSAVFAPLPSVGLIAVDEEHDASYKQEESPRYHGRDVAIMRAKRCGALVVLGSATPSLESYRHAASGRYRRFALSQRVKSRPLPTVRIVDMREEFAEHGPDVVLGGLLAEAIDTRLIRREQVLLLLNRRGFAAALFCRQCGRSLECPNCSVSLTFHRSAGRARCHYCGYSRTRPVSCPECAGPYLEQIGFGTERVEAEVVDRWPDARVARLDRDTVRRKGAAARLLDRFSSGAVDVLVGTQMVAKGHDFPRVTLVGVISADVGLGMADFRAGERTFQLLTQVAGRAGRGEVTGEAFVQTLYPDHYSIRHACNQAYRPFYDEEMRFRKAMRYPPMVSLVSAVVRGTTFRQTMQEAADLAARLRAPPESVRCHGTGGGADRPAPRSVSGAAVSEGPTSSRDAGGAARGAGWPHGVETEDRDRRRPAVNAVATRGAAPRIRRAMWLLADEIDKLEWCGREAENEHDQRADRYQQSRAVESDVVIERPGMARTELDEHEHGQDCPGDPAERIEGEENHGSGSRQGDKRGATAKRGIGDVAPVELPDREQIQRGDKQAEPGGQAHRVEDERGVVWRRAPDHPGGKAEQRRLTEHEPAEALGQQHDARQAESQKQRRHRHNEAGDRSGHADVEEHPLGGNRLPGC